MATAVTLYGFDATQAGDMVTVWLAGLDCGDYVVSAAGAVTVPYGSDPGGLLTAAYLQGVSDDAPSSGWPYAAQIDITIDGAPSRVVVPCVCGFNFVTQGQLMRPAVELDVRAKTGPGIGMTKRIHMFGAQVAQTITGSATGSADIGVSFGTSFTQLLPAVFTYANNEPLPTDELFAGIYWNTIDADYSFDSQLCWQVSRPYPCTLTALSGYMVTAER